MARIRREEKTGNVKKKWFFGKYERLSKEDILKGDSRSIQSQNMTLDNYLDNLIVDGEDVTIVDTYKDDGASGMYDKRSEFQKMIADIENGRINAVIVCDLSRMFRNDADQKYYLEYYFREKKTRIISCSLPQLDTFKEPDRIFSMDVKFQAMTNANMLIETSIKIKDKLATRRKQGLFVGSFAPYGYKKHMDNKNQLIIDDEASEVVRDIFNWFVYENMSIHKIVERLNELGIPNPTAYKKLKGSKYSNSNSNNSGLWSDGTVRNILKSEYYIGNMDQHHYKTVFTADRKKVVPLEQDEISEIVQNTHPAIIDINIFELAQKLLSRDRRTAPEKKHNYLFSGFLVCGDCQKSMIAKKAKHINYYYCSTYVKRSKTACTKHTFREDDLEEAVLKCIQLQISLAIDMKEKVDKINSCEEVNHSSKRIESLLENTQSSLVKQQNIQDSLYVDWKNGDISREQHNRLRVKTEEKIQNLNNVIKTLLHERETLKSNMKDSNHYLQTFCKYKNIQKLDSKIMIELIDKIYIYENKSINIKFNFEDEYKLTTEFIENNKLQ